MNNFKLFSIYILTFFLTSLTKIDLPLGNPSQSNFFSVPKNSMTFNFSDKLQLDIDKLDEKTAQCLKEMSQSLSNQLFSSRNVNMLFDPAEQRAEYSLDLDRFNFFYLSYSFKSDEIRISFSKSASNHSRTTLMRLTLSENKSTNLYKEHLPHFLFSEKSKKQLNDDKGFKLGDQIQVHKIKVFAPKGLDPLMLFDETGSKTKIEIDRKHLFKCLKSLK